MIVIIMLCVLRTQNKNLSLAKCRALARRIGFKAGKDPRPLAWCNKKPDQRPGAPRECYRQTRLILLQLSQTILLQHFSMYLYSMNLTSIVTDEYIREARTYPALISVLPVLLTCLFITDMSKYNAASLARDAVLFCGLLALVSYWVRVRGTRLQEKVLKDWGCMPTTELLRWNDNTFSTVQKEAFRQKLHTLIPNLTLPTARAERANPAKADAIYERTCTWLRENTRDKTKFRLVMAENIRYGFIRNLLALKTPALILASTCLFITVWQLTPYFTPALRLAELPPLKIALLVFLMGYIWALEEFVTLHEMRRAAKGYARQLLAAIESL